MTSSIPPAPKRILPARSSGLGCENKQSLKSPQKTLETLPNESLAHIGALASHNDRLALRSVNRRFGGITTNLMTHEFANMAASSFVANLTARRDGSAQQSRSGRPNAKPLEDYVDKFHVVQRELNKADGFPVKSLGIFWRDIAQNANALFMEQRLWGASRLWDHVADLFPNVQHIRGWSSEWTRPAFGLPLGSTPCPWPLLREVEGAELGSERFFERAVCHDRDVSFENAVRQIIIRPAFRFSWMSWCDPNEPFWFLDPIPERLSAENTNPCSLYKMNIFGLTPWLEELGLIFKYRPSLFLHGAPSRDAPLCGALAKEQIEGALRWLMVKDLSNLKKLTFVYDKFAAEEGLGHVRLFLLNLAVGVESVKTWWLSYKNEPLPSVLRHCLLRLAWDPVIHQKDQVEALLSDLSEKTGIHMSLTDSAYESVSWTQFAYVERSDDQIAQRKSELLRREDLWRGGSCSRIFVLPS